MSRPRRRIENRGLPPNLHTHPKGFRYRRPDGTYCYLGRDRKAACDAAIAANLHYTQRRDLFDKIVEGDAKNFSQVVGDYLADKLPTLDISAGTRQNRIWCFKKMQTSQLAAISVEDITTRDLYLYLQTLASDWTRQNYRALLRQLFTWTVTTGLREDNPAISLERPNAKRSRQRLTFEAFQTIRAHAEPWLQNMMDLQLQTLQRPGDVVGMLFADICGDALRVVQRKTGKKIELQIGTELREVLDRCRDGVLSPFIVHRLPEKARPRHMRAKSRTHHTQVLLEQAERAFDEARKASGLYSATDSPPTPHEIRSLGAALYRDSGWPEGEVQRLMGHSEVQMTRHYLQGHEAPWERIAAGLKLPAVRY